MKSYETDELAFSLQPYQEELLKELSKNLSPRPGKMMYYANALPGGQSEKEWVERWLTWKDVADYTMLDLLPKVVVNPKSNALYMTRELPASAMDPNDLPLYPSAWYFDEAHSVDDTPKIQSMVDLLGSQGLAWETAFRRMHIAMSVAEIRDQLDRDLTVYLRERSVGYSVYASHAGAYASYQVPGFEDRIEAGVKAMFDQMDVQGPTFQKRFRFRQGIRR